MSYKVIKSNSEDNKYGLLVYNCKCMYSRNECSLRYKQLLLFLLFSNTFNPNMSTKRNMNFKLGFVHCSNFCSGNLCILWHIKLDNGAFIYFNIAF